MLVVGAAEDRITPAGVVRKVARRYGADLRLYEGFAHMLPLEPGCERIAEDILVWLERVLET